jgi:hypothetical protein
LFFPFDVSKEFTYVFNNKPFQPTTTATPFSSPTALAMMASYTSFSSLNIPVDSLQKMCLILVDVDSDCTTIPTISPICTVPTSKP